MLLTFFFFPPCKSRAACESNESGREKERKREREKEGRKNRGHVIRVEKNDELIDKRAGKRRETEREEKWEKRESKKKNPLGSIERPKSSL